MTSIWIKGALDVAESELSELFILLQLIILLL